MQVISGGVRKFSFPGFRFTEGPSNAQKLEKENICPDHFPDFNLKSSIVVKNIFIMKNLTDFRKKVETGVNSHLLVVLSSNPRLCL